MNKTVMASIAVLVAVPLFSNIGPQGFHGHKNPYFVETGTFGGDGALKALQAGFGEIRTIEFDENLYKGARHRLSRYPNVKVFHGSSADMLWDVIKDINAPITFWLDAHIYPPIEGVQNCPLLEELEQIKRHPIKHHTILIDDMHCAGTEAFDFLTKDDLMAKILEINPNYTISYMPGGDAGEYPENVMVAHVSM